MTKLLSLRAICNYKSPKNSAPQSLTSASLNLSLNSNPNSANFVRLTKKLAKAYKPTILQSPQKFSTLAKVRKPSHKIQQKPAKAKPPKTQNLKSTPSFVLKDDEAPP